MKDLTDKQFTRSLVLNQFRQVSKLRFVDTSGVIPESKELEAILSCAYGRRRFQLDRRETLRQLRNYREWWKGRVKLAEELKEYWCAESQTFRSLVEALPGA